MRHAGILAHSVEGASLCLVTFCREGFGTLGPHEHPDVTLDCIALARSMAAWASGDYAAVRLVLAQPSIGSQIVDNLNASSHVRAVLTDLFLLDDALKR